MSVMDLYLDSAVSFIYNTKDRRKNRRNRSNDLDIKECASKYYFVNDGERQKTLRHMLNNEAVQTKISNMFQEFAGICSVNANEEVVVNNVVNAGEIFGYYTGQLKLFDDRDSSLYLIRTQLMQSDKKGKQIGEIDVYIDAFYYKSIKYDIAKDETLQGNLMCFIDHGCPGCSNVDVKFYDVIEILYESRYFNYKLSIPCVQAKEKLVKGTVLRYDYGHHYGASTQRQLLLDGFNSVMCNCPMHQFRGFPDWYIPNSNDPNAHYPTDEKLGEEEQLRSQSETVYAQMQEIAKSMEIAKSKRNRRGCVPE